MSGYRLIANVKIFFFFFLIIFKAVTFLPVSDWVLILVAARFKCVNSELCSWLEAKKERKKNNNNKSQPKAREKKRERRLNLKQQLSLFQGFLREFFITDDTCLSFFPFFNRWRRVNGTLVNYCTCKWGKSRMKQVKASKCFKSPPMHQQKLLWCKEARHKRTSTVNTSDRTNCIRTSHTLTHTKYTVSGLNWT